MQVSAARALQSVFFCSLPLKGRARKNKNERLRQFDCPGKRHSLHVLLLKNMDRKGGLFSPLRLLHGTRHLI